MTRRLTIADPVLRVPPTYVHIPTRRDLTIMLSMAGETGGQGATAIEATLLRKGQGRYAEPRMYWQGKSPRNDSRVDLPLTVFRSLLRRGWIEPYFFGTVTVRFHLSADGHDLIALLRDKG